MNNVDVDIQKVLLSLRETIGIQAQEIAVLKATISVLQEQSEETDKV